MVEAVLETQRQRAQIVLRPNQSWSWRANLALLASLSVLSLTIATGFLLHGMWPILPFTLLELTVVYFSLRYLVARNQRREVITFSADEVTIERGRRGAQERHTFNRYWAHFSVTTPALPRRERRIAIRSHGREQEIGGFLNATDKAELVEHLQTIIAEFRAINAPQHT